MSELIDLLKRVQTVMACAALTQIRNGEKVYEEFSKFLENPSKIGMIMTSLDTLWPNPSEHNRVIIYTEGSDFDGKQYFDIGSEKLIEYLNIEKEFRPDIVLYATHWMPVPDHYSHEFELRLQSAERAIQSMSLAERNLKEVCQVVEDAKSSLRANSIKDGKLVEMVGDLVRRDDELFVRNAILSARIEALRSDFGDAVAENAKLVESLQGYRALATGVRRLLDESPALTKDLPEIFGSKCNEPVDRPKIIAEFKEWYSKRYCITELPPKDTCEHARYWDAFEVWEASRNQNGN